MESTDNNGNDDESAAAELQTSVLQLPKRHAAHLLVCRGLHRSPLQPIPRHPSQPKRCCGGSSLRPYQPPVAVPSIPKLQLTFHPSGELPRPQACFWASCCIFLPIPHPALLPRPASRLRLRPVHPPGPPGRRRAVPGLLQLRWLQLPCRSGLLQFSVTDGAADLQTRIRSPAAVLLKALLPLLSIRAPRLNSSLLCCLSPLLLPPHSPLPPAPPLVSPLLLYSHA